MLLDHTYSNFNPAITRFDLIHECKCLFNTSTAPVLLLSTGVLNEGDVGDDGVPALADSAVSANGFPATAAHA
jgi:hypothetical protein